jgi:hypothetical protein
MASFLFKTKRIVALSSLPQLITEGSATLSGWTFLNPNPVVVFVKLYDSVSPTVGVSTPITILPLPAGGLADPGVFLKEDNESFRRFVTGMAIAATTSYADDDTTAPINPIYCEVVWE